MVVKKELIYIYVRQKVKLQSMGNYNSAQIQQNMGE